MVRRLVVVMALAGAVAGCASTPAKSSNPPKSTTSAPVLGAQPPSTPLPPPSLEITTTVPPKG